jgi:hypothetical protein
MQSHLDLPPKLFLFEHGLMLSAMTVFEGRDCNMQWTVLIYRSIGLNSKFHFYCMLKINYL